jgi:hypothetical protein
LPSADRPKKSHATQKILLPFFNYFFFISEIFVPVSGIFGILVVFPLGQLQPNFGGMVLGWPPSKIVSVILTSNQDGRQAKNIKKGG